MTDKFTEKEYVSKCCGKKIVFKDISYLRGKLNKLRKITITDFPVCRGCWKPCEVIEKEE